MRTSTGAVSAISDGEMNNQEPPLQSDGVRMVERRVSVDIKRQNGPSSSRDGVVIAYEPTTNQHTVKFDDTGEERSFIIDLTHFDWSAESSVAVDKPNARLQKSNAGARLLMAVRREVVGRPLKVLERRSEKWFHGTIVGFCEKSGKHRIKFETMKKERELRLEKGKFKWTDLVGPEAYRTKDHVLSTSRYIGVTRNTEKTWEARCYANGKTVYLGRFPSEKAAALAHDVYARKEGRPINFPAETMREAELDRRERKKETSPFRGVCVRNGRHGYIVQVGIKRVLEGLGCTTKQTRIGSFPNERQAALAYDRVCRKYGVAEKELNFPRNDPLEEVRLFDDECYFCCEESPVDPVATPCNHSFCRPCATELLKKKQCPCCQTPVPSKKALTPVTLMHWPSKKKSGTSCEYNEALDDFDSKPRADGGPTKRNAIVSPELVTRKNRRVRDHIGEADESQASSDSDRVQ